MEVQVHDTHKAFQETAGPFLAANPVRNTVALTAIERAHPDALMITLHNNGTLAGAVIQVPPYPLVTSAMPVDAAEATAKAVHAIKPNLTGASGPMEPVQAFAAAWTALTGAKADLVFAMRLFELGELKPPTVAGQPRRPTEADLPMLTTWIQSFLDDTLHGAATEPAADQARAMLTPGRICFIWEVDGTPVSFAAARGPVSGMVRVAPVYTPPEHRGHGYASAVTAAATQWAIDQKADHILIFTDLSNPTTNKIYPQIGYQPLEDSAEYAFK